ncbi:MAG: AtpZ/AtpI family protein [Candidatus Rokubacteria bacterium]|nr:AtpZ/AtpI family protein [Candidatus Rokubacteria bacterium]
MSRDGRQSSWRGVARYANLGATLVMCLVIGLAGGYWADRWLGTAPWLVMVGLGFGIAAGARVFYQAIQALNRSHDVPQEPKDDNR